MKIIIWTDDKNKLKVKETFNKIKNHYEKSNIPIKEEINSHNIPRITFVNGDVCQVINLNNKDSYRGHKCGISYIDTDLVFLDFPAIPMVQIATVGKNRTFVYF